MKLIIQVIVFSLFFSCSKKSKNNDLGPALINQQKEFADSLPYELWYATFSLIPESEIVQIDQLDNEAETVGKKTKLFRDSIINSIDLNKLSKKKESEYLLKEALANGNQEVYCKIVHDGLLQTELYPYSLYMAEKHNFVPAYDDVFQFFYKKNYILFKKKKQEEKKSLLWDEMALAYLDENERYLALYCLIQSYKKGNIYNANNLSYYFRKGLYFPKDIKTANKLDSIYEYRPLIKQE